MAWRARLIRMHRRSVSCEARRCTPLCARSIGRVRCMPHTRARVALMLMLTRCDDGALSRSQQQQRSSRASESSDGKRQRGATPTLQSGDSTRKRENATTPVEPRGKTDRRERMRSNHDTCKSNTAESDGFRRDYSQAWHERCGCKRRWSRWLRAFGAESRSTLWPQLAAHAATNRVYWKSVCLLFGSARNKVQGPACGRRTKQQAPGTEKS